MSKTAPDEKLRIAVIRLEVPPSSRGLLRRDFLLVPLSAYIANVALAHLTLEENLRPDQVYVVDIPLDDHVLRVPTATEVREILSSNYGHDETNRPFDLVLYIVLLSDKYYSYETPSISVHDNVVYLKSSLQYAEKDPNGVAVMLSNEAKKVYEKTRTTGPEQLD